MISVIAVSTALTSLALGAGVSAASVRALSTAGPCGTMPLSSTHYQHFIWVWMENHSYSTIIGSLSAPYINTLAKECGLATNYHNISHPSLPNYLGATAGLSVVAVQKFASDCNPSPICDTSSASVFSQARTWRAYEESIPANCAPANAGEYAVRHNPPPYFTTLTGCSSFDVPYTQLTSDLTRGTLPEFAFITPNLIDDMHDGTVAQGDTWLKTHLPSIFASSAYRTGKTVVFVTWDEGEGGSSNNCPANTTDVGCHVATLVVSPSTRPHTTSGILFSHYSLLRTTEELLHVGLLGQAAQAHSMKTAFDL